MASHSEPGLATRLITSCLSFLSKIPRQSQAQPPSRSPHGNEFGRFKLWALGFDTSGGQFDELLEQAQYLKEPTIFLLSNFAVLLYKFFAKGSDDDTLMALDNAVENAKELYPDISHCCYDNDSEEDPCWIVDELRGIMDSLFRLAPALGEIQEEISYMKLLLALEISPTQCYERIILDNFPDARPDLVSRLAEGNENLFKSLMNRSKELPKKIAPDPKIMETIPATADVQKKPPPYSTSHAQSSAVKSSAVQSAVQSSTVPSTMQSSMFQDSGLGSSVATSLNVPPRAKSVFSEITQYSTFSSLENRSSILQLPKSQGVAGGYDCPICQHKQTGILNAHQWRKHIFVDIKPYMCTYETCDTEGKSFESWQLWMEHEKKMHHSRSICGEESHTKSCPLCLQEIESSQGSFYKHVRRHMEDIRIFALPPSLRQSHDEEDLEADDAFSDNFSSTKSIVGRSGVLSPISEEPSSELGSKFSFEDQLKTLKIPGHGLIVQGWLSGESRIAETEDDIQKPISTEANPSAQNPDAMEVVRKLGQVTWKYELEMERRRLRGKRS